jgi:hypothetical protein
MTNPFEHDNADGYHDDAEPKARCRACDGVLDDTPGEYIEWNGWLWCVDHGKEMQRMAMSEDFMNETRR